MSHMSNTNGVTTHWNEVASNYDNLMATDRAYQAQLDNIISELSGTPNRILDLGCGTGAIMGKLVKKYPNAQIVGLDPAIEMLNVIKGKFAGNEKIDYVSGSAHQLEFEDNSFDYIVTNWALHHLIHDDKVKCAQEVYRVLKPGGKFINGDQFAEVMGEIKSPDRAGHILDLLSRKAKYYLEEVSFERMLLQVKLMPKFLTEDGECLATPEFWVDAMQNAGFVNTKILISEPAYLFNRVVVGLKKGD